jgi:hypothetical protein
MILKILKILRDIFSLKRNNKIDGKVINLFLESVQLHISHLIREKTEPFKQEYFNKVVRGNIVWVDFGFNVGHEFGGKHPAIILKYINDKQDIYVVPLDSGVLPVNKRKIDGKPKNGFVEIPMMDNGCLTVFDMSKMDRWCNVYRLRCISWVRIDFNSNIGRMRNDYVEKIESEILKNQFKPVVKKSHKNSLTKAV